MILEKPSRMLLFLWVVSLQDAALLTFIKGTRPWAQTAGLSGAPSIAVTPHLSLGASLFQCLPRQSLHQCQLSTLNRSHLGSLSSPPPCRMFWFCSLKASLVSRWTGKGERSYQSWLCVVLQNGRGELDWQAGRGWGRRVTHPALASCDRICEYHVE
jgi:hypothetical protein